MASSNIFYQVQPVENIFKNPYLVYTTNNWKEVMGSLNTVVGNGTQKGWEQTIQNPQDLLNKKNGNHTSKIQFLNYHTAKADLLLFSNLSLL